MVQARVAVRQQASCAARFASGRFPDPLRHGGTRPSTSRVVFTTRSPRPRFLPAVSTTGSRSRPLDGHGHGQNAKNRTPPRTLALWPRRRRDAKPAKKAPRCVHQRGFLVGPGGPVARGSKPLARPFLREKSGHVNLHRGGQPTPDQPKRPSNEWPFFVRSRSPGADGAPSAPPMVPPKEPPATRSQETPTVVLSRPPASGSPVRAS